MKTIFTSILLVLIFALNLYAQKEDKTFQVYGFVMTDAGYQVNTIDPNWYDVLRATKLPSYDKQFAPDGKIFFSARQSRFGVKSSVPTAIGNFKTHFEFDMFGVGNYAGQTTIRLRHAYGQIGKFGAGQTNSAFMDGDVFPNSLEYWGPTGMIFFRNIQVRYMPMMDKNNDLTFALEAPGASGDAGIYSDRVELKNVKPLFNAPDFSGHYRYTGDWGYFQVGGIVRSIKWRDITDSLPNLDGSAVGWGGTVSSNINFGKKAVLRIQGVYGEGIQNYMNDAPVDVGLKNTGDTLKPVEGIALPLWAATAFLDINWDKKFSSSIGYSVETIDNSNAQSPDAYKQGQYALVNLLYYPVDNFTAGVEVLFARRDNFSDGFHSTNPQVRFGFKYNFSRMFTWN